MRLEQYSPRSSLFTYTKYKDTIEHLSIMCGPYLLSSTPFFITKDKRYDSYTLKIRNKHEVRYYLDRRVEICEH